MEQAYLRNKMTSFLMETITILLRQLTHERK